MDIVQNLTDFYIPCGAERQGSEKLKEYLSYLFEEIRADALGNLLCLVKKGEPGQKKVLLEAHIDEVSLVVSNIDHEGFIHVISPYGLDIRAVASKEMLIHGEEPVYAVSSSVPPHLKSGDKKDEPLKISDFVLDAGLSKDTAHKLVRVGDRVTFKGGIKPLLNGKIAGRALDNRAGAAAVITAAKALSGRQTNCELWVLLSTEEEAGTKGAAAGGFTINPDIALAVDVSFGKMPGVEDYEGVALSGGVMPGTAPILDKELYKMLCIAADKCGVPFSPEVMTGSTGTNAASLMRVRKGVKTALLSIPLLNMHTPSEVISLSDLKAAVNVIARFVCML